MDQPLLLSSGARVVGGVRFGQSTSLLDFDTDLLMGLAKNRAKKPDVFETNPPYFWRAEVSNDRIDSYFTRMHESTLRNFAQAGSDGIAFQYSHDYRRLGLGKSLLGQYERLTTNIPNAPVTNDGSEKSQRTIIDFFTVPGMRLNSDISTNDFILGVDSGVLEDVSVGFYADTIKCSICGGDMFFSWFGGIYGRCDHYPGMTYEDPYMDTSGNAYGGSVLCYAWIHDGILSETSQVYDGACPDAGVLKATMAARDGLLTDQRAIATLERQLRMKLPGGAIIRQGATPGQGDMSMGTRKVKRASDDDVQGGLDPAVVEEIDETVTLAVADPVTPDPTVEDDEEEDDGTEDERSMLDDLQARFTGDGIVMGTTARATIEGLCNTIVDLRSKASGLTSRAKWGDAYRAKLVADGLRAAAAAFGDNYDEATYRPLLENAAPEVAQRLVDGWDAVANQRFPGGRRTTDETIRLLPTSTETSGVNDREDNSAYR